MRLIDADELAEELSKRVWYEREDEKQAVRIVKESSTVDAVPVVRCKDCTPIICPMHNINKSDNCYCSLRDLERELYNLMKEKLGAKPVD